VVTELIPDRFESSHHTDLVHFAGSKIHPANHRSIADGVSNTQRPDLEVAKLGRLAPREARLISGRLSLALDGLAEADQERGGIGYSRVGCTEIILLTGRTAGAGG